MVGDQSDKAFDCIVQAHAKEGTRIHLDVVDGSYIYYNYPKFYIVNPAQATRRVSKIVKQACRYVQKELDEGERNVGFVTATFS